MLAPHIRKKVDKLWDRFWSAGITNPLVAVEQITYLLFLKRLESVDLTRQGRSLPMSAADWQMRTSSSIPTRARSSVTRSISSTNYLPGRAEARLRKM